MRIIIDTNIIISAILKDNDPERVIQHIIENEDLEWIASQEILDEYINILHRKKFGLPKELIDAWLNLFKRKIKITAIDHSLRVHFPRDNNDEKFIHCAITNAANFLITGDKDFNEAKKILSTNIVSVAQFKKLFFI